MNPVRSRRILSPSKTQMSLVIPTMVGFASTTHPHYRMGKDQNLIEDLSREHPALAVLNGENNLMKRYNATFIFLLCCFVSSSKGATTEEVTVIANLPTTTSYVWKNSKLRGNAHKAAVTCFSVECTAYINAPMPLSGGGATQATVELLMPDGTINVVGCFRRPESLGHSNLRTSLSCAQFR
jgi:hypothetical protein